MVKKDFTNLYSHTDLKRQDSWTSSEDELTDSSGTLMHQQTYFHYHYHHHHHHMFGKVGCTGPYTLEISKYFIYYLVSDRWHAVTLGSRVDITGYSPNLFLLPPVHRVLLHVPGTLEVSVAIGPGCSTWNVKRNDLSYLQAWPIKIPNCHSLCLSSQVNDLGTHIWKMEKLQDGKEPEFFNYYLEENQPLSGSTYLNFKWARSTFLFVKLLIFWSLCVTAASITLTSMISLVYD